MTATFQTEKLPDFSRHICSKNLNKCTKFVNLDSNILLCDAMRSVGCAIEDVSPSVCPSVYPSHTSILSKHLSLYRFTELSLVGLALDLVDCSMTLSVGSSDP